MMLLFGSSSEDDDENVLGVTEVAVYLRYREDTHRLYDLELLIFLASAETLFSRPDAVPLW